MIEFDDLQKMNPSKAKGMGGADGSIHQLVTMIQGACGLDTDWAKAISYYALATHGLPNLKSSLFSYSKGRQAQARAQYSAF